MAKLVNLAEIFEVANSLICYEAETKSAVAPLVRGEVSVQMYLLRRPDSTAETIVRDVRLSATAVRQALRSLEQRGLIDLTPSSASAVTANPTYRASARGVELHHEARRYAKRHLRYAMSGISDSNQAKLIEATEALGSLATALGYRAINDTYRREA